MNEPVGAGWRLRSSDGVEYFELTVDPRLAVIFFTRLGGRSHGHFAALNCSHSVGDEPSAVRANLDLAAAAAGVGPFVTLRQVHSDTVVHVKSAEVGPDEPEGDAGFTSVPGAGLGLRVADCLPVFVIARDRSCVGIAHCGWRGTAIGLAGKLAVQMAAQFSASPSDFEFALGPSICPRCYPVGDDVRAAFVGRFPARDRFLAPLAPGPSGPAWSLDIRAANRWLLSQAGLTELGSLDRCTCENPDHFYSARRAQPTGRNLALVAVRSRSRPADRQTG